MVRRPVGVVGHADQVEGVHHPAVELRAREPEVRRPEPDVGPHRAHEQLVVGVLEDDADPAPDLAQVLARHRQAADRDLPAPGREDAVEVQHERGLAGAVGPQERDPLTLLDPEIDAVQRLVAVGVGEREPPDVEHGDAHR